MDKNWLIRTKSNHILGPVSKEKVVELFKNGSIRADDEVCSGNGYWFFIREDDLVERFLTGEEKQGFNPISEAKDVLTDSDRHLDEIAEIQNADITLVGSINLSDLNEKKEDKVDKSTEESKREENFSTLEMSENLKLQPSFDQKEKKTKARARLKSVINVDNQTTVLKTQKWLKILGLLGAILLFTLVYYRKVIIHRLFNGEISSIQLNIFNEANAQDFILGKKKTF